MTRNPENRELISGCIQNNRQAQEQLYKQYYGSMVSLCLRYTKNQEDAIEVLHNGFLKVFRKMQTFDPSKASLYTWIRSIIVNSAIDFLRQKDKLHSGVDIGKIEEPSIDSDVIHRMSAQEVLLLVQQLPTATQTVFNLYIIEGYTHKEVAGLLGISEGTSKWHLSEARRQLKQLLQTLEV